MWRISSHWVVCFTRQPRVMGTQDSRNRPYSPRAGSRWRSHLPSRESQARWQSDDGCQEKASVKPELDTSPYPPRAGQLPQS